MRGRPVAALLAAGATAVCAALPGGAAAQSPGAPAVSAYPSPGTPTVSPRTTISFRGRPPGELGPIVVRGERSGRHAGVLRPHSDGGGASLVFKRAFRPGERVTVRTRLEIAGARNGDFVLRISRPPPPLVIGGNFFAQRVHANAFRRFRSRPDLHPPKVTVIRREAGTAPGAVILGPKPKAPRHQAGPMIVDDAGELVWFHPLGGHTQATDVRVQRYRGQPVLTWWQGTSRQGIGTGHMVIMDDTYRVIAQVRAGNGYRADLHEFLITPQNTALLIAYPAVRADLSAVGGSRHGVAIDSVIQEIDLATGLVVFEWHSIGHVPIADSHFRAPPNRYVPYDYFHANSVGLAPDGDIVVGARNTWGVYKVARATGAIAWQLGGRHNQFRRGRGARFAWQHDARLRADGTLTVFDNAATPRRRDHSRALVLAVDPAARTARLVQAREHPRGLLVATQGDVQTLPGDGLFVGWGSRRFFSEFAPGGQLLWDAHLAVGYDTYRAYRAPWAAQPATRPRVAALARRGGRMAVFASWNGATGVASWEVLAGPRRGRLAPVASAARTGFETRIAVTGRARWVAARARDAAGTVLATSPARRLQR